MLGVTPPFVYDKRMSDPIQQIKDRLSIVDVVGQYVKLTKAGKNYKGLSPFQNEKTPSFYVQPDKGLYYDFSSGQGGDMFTFLQQMEGLDFQGALRSLADRAGVELKRESKQSRDARERLYEVLDTACRFYETKLAESGTALAYLRERGLEKPTIRQFRIGFAPDDWSSVLEHLTSHGYREHEIERAGLIKKGEKGKYYDRFRSRIMFPISDAAGRVVAFSGRITGEAAKDDKNAKYINSPETELFEKSRILYGYDKAKQHIRKYDFAILVEGQMDIVMSHQAGYKNTVAVSGTGLTDTHLALLERLSKKLVMAFDADAAGIASSGRAAALALHRGMDVKVAQVPVGKDPADCIRENPALWKEAVKESKHVIEYYLSVLEEKNSRKGGDARKLALAIRDTVLPYVARIPSGVDQAHFVRMVANALGMVEDAIWQDVRLHARELQKGSSESRRQTIPQGNSAKVLGRLEHNERALAGFLFWQESLEPRILNESHVRSYADKLSLALEPLLAKYDKERDILSFEAELHNSESIEPATVLEQLMTQVSREYLRKERSELSEELRRAERSGDSVQASRLLKRFQELSARIESLE